ncbi:hypothetical protein HDU87_006281 [Geranomyces variabilis]|uniref:Uncharacterized protein n=1 Tax=Geranomyces variabilis TaxID=109894 RepID=A0AAD5TGB3_9FUNG|nr:hypothetical protein HDU87_006281 [Geranomyces variabilis]
MAQQQQYHGHRATYCITAPAVPLAFSSIYLHPEVMLALAPCGTTPALAVNAGIAVRFTTATVRTNRQSPADLGVALASGKQLRRPVVPPTPRGDFVVLWSRPAQAVPAWVLELLQQRPSVPALPATASAAFLNGAVRLRLTNLALPHFSLAHVLLRAVIEGWTRSFGDVVSKV